MVKIILSLEGGIFMKNKNTFAKDRKFDENSAPEFDDCSEMFEEGYSDLEIAHELGVQEDYIKRLREEYQKEY